MREYRFKIEGVLPGLNDYTAANRSNVHAGSQMKKKAEERVMTAIDRDLPGVRVTSPVWITFIWNEPTKRRDLDNVAFAKKFILDGMVKAGLLQNDDQIHVKGFQDLFFHSPKNGSVEVILKEHEDAKRKF